MPSELNIKLEPKIYERTDYDGGVDEVVVWTAEYGGHTYKEMSKAAVLRSIADTMDASMLEL